MECFFGTGIIGAMKLLGLAVVCDGLPLICSSSPSLKNSSSLDLTSSKNNSLLLLESSSPSVTEIESGVQYSSAPT